MALKKSYSSKYGTNHSESYHMVGSATGGGDEMQCNVLVYASAAARTANSGSINSSWYQFAYSASVNESFISQSYEHLKGLPEYTGSLNV